jgi:hypothetical protein
MPALMLNKSTRPRMSVRIPIANGIVHVRWTHFGRSSMPRASPWVVVGTSASPFEHDPRQRTMTDPVLSG